MSMESVPTQHEEVKCDISVNSECTTGTQDVGPVVTEQMTNTEEKEHITSSSEDATNTSSSSNSFDSYDVTDSDTVTSGNDTYANRNQTNESFPGSVPNPINPKVSDKFVDTNGDNAIDGLETLGGDQTETYTVKNHVKLDHETSSVSVAELSILDPLPGSDDDSRQSDSEPDSVLGISVSKPEHENVTVKNPVISDHETSAVSGAELSILDPLSDSDEDSSQSDLETSAVSGNSDSEPDYENVTVKNLVRSGYETSAVSGTELSILDPLSASDEDYSPSDLETSALSGSSDSEPEHGDGTVELLLPFMSQNSSPDSQPADDHNSEDNISLTNSEINTTFESHIKSKKEKLNEGNKETLGLSNISINTVQTPRTRTGGINRSPKPHRSFVISSRQTEKTKPKTKAKTEKNKKDTIETQPSKSDEKAFSEIQKNINNENVISVTQKNESDESGKIAPTKKELKREQRKQKKIAKHLKKVQDSVTRMGVNLAIHGSETSASDISIKDNARSGDKAQTCTDGIVIGDKQTLPCNSVHPFHKNEENPKRVPNTANRQNNDTNENKSSRKEKLEDSSPNSVQPVTTSSRNTSIKDTHNNNRKVFGKKRQRSENTFVPSLSFISEKPSDSEENTPTTTNNSKMKDKSLSTSDSGPSTRKQVSNTEMDSHTRKNAIQIDYVNSVKPENVKSQTHTKLEPVENTSKENSKSDLGSENKKHRQAYTPTLNRSLFAEVVKGKISGEAGGDVDHQRSAVNESNATTGADKFTQNQPTPVLVTETDESRNKSASTTNSIVSKNLQNHRSGHVNVLIPKTNEKSHCKPEQTTEEKSSSMTAKTLNNQNTPSTITPVNTNIGTVSSSTDCLGGTQKSEGKTVQSNSKEHSEQTFNQNPCNVSIPNKSFSGHLPKADVTNEINQSLQGILRTQPEVENIATNTHDSSTPSSSQAILYEPRQGSEYGNAFFPIQTRQDSLQSIRRSKPPKQDKFYNITKKCANEFDQSQNGQAHKSVFHSVKSKPLRSSSSCESNARHVPCQKSSNQNSRSVSDLLPASIERFPFHVDIDRVFKHEKLDYQTHGGIDNSDLCAKKTIVYIFESEISCEQMHKMTFLANMIYLNSINKDLVYEFDNPSEITKLFYNDYHKISSTKEIKKIIQFYNIHIDKDVKVGMTVTNIPVSIVISAIFNGNEYYFRGMIDFKSVKDAFRRLIPLYYHSSDAPTFGLYYLRDSELGYSQAIHYDRTIAYAHLDEIDDLNIADYILVRDPLMNEKKHHDALAHSPRIIGKPKDQSQLTKRLFPIVDHPLYSMLTDIANAINVQVYSFFENINYIRYKKKIITLEVNQSIVIDKYILLNNYIAYYNQKIAFNNLSKHKMHQPLIRIQYIQFCQSRLSKQANALEISYIPLVSLDKICFKQSISNVNKCKGNMARRNNSEENSEQVFNCDADKLFEEMNFDNNDNCRNVQLDTRKSSQFVTQMQEANHISPYLLADNQNNNPKLRENRNTKSFNVFSYCLLASLETNTYFEMDYINHILKSINYFHITTQYRRRFLTKAIWDNIFWLNAKMEAGDYKFDKIIYAEYFFQYIREIQECKLRVDMIPGVAIVMCDPLSYFAVIRQGNFHGTKFYKRAHNNVFFNIIGIEAMNTDHSSQSVINQTNFNRYYETRHQIEEYNPSYHQNLTNLATIVYTSQHTDIYRKRGDQSLSTYFQPVETEKRQVPVQISNKPDNTNWVTRNFPQKDNHFTCYGDYRSQQFDILAPVKKLLEDLYKVKLTPYVNAIIDGFYVRLHLGCYNKKTRRFFYSILVKNPCNFCDCDDFLCDYMLFQFELDSDIYKVYHGSLQIS